MNYNDVEQSRPIPGFDRYEVTNHGRVINITTGRNMVLSPTLDGILTVGLVLNGKQYRRSVKVLVARAFVPGESEMMNTPIQLDGDQTNLRSDNLVWRPRWFALEYIKQFDDPPTWYFSAPIVETRTGTTYKNVMEASMTHGELCKHIRRSILNGTAVFPTGHIYVYM